MMRLAPLACVVVAIAPAIVVTACASQEQQTAPSNAAAAQRPAPSESGSDAPSLPPEYVLAEPYASARPLTTLLLGDADPHGDPPRGILIGGTRLVAHGASYSVAKSVAAPPIVAAFKVPKRFGGGFLFRSSNTVYTSPTFDGALTPLVTTPTEIVGLSFAPNALFVGGSGGQRWAVQIPSGTRVPLSPLAVAQVAALDDGRAAALDLAGHALVSIDAGKTWSDVTPKMRGNIDAVTWDDSTISFSVTQPTGTVEAFHVEAGGKLVAYAQQPIRPQKGWKGDARWHSAESPIHRAVRLGATLDDGTAIVEADGDVFRIDPATGTIRSVAAGHLPPDATCEAVRVPDDVVLVCTRPTQIGFVASHTVGDKVPVIEQTFGVAGQLTASDDGAIAFAGPCSKPKPSRSIVCVRSTAGAWQEYDLADTMPDGGPPYDVMRWLPRADGSALGVVTGQTPGLVDAHSGDFHAWASGPNGQQPYRPGFNYMAQFRNGPGYGRTSVVDRTASLTSAGTIRVWGQQAEAIDMSLDGESTQSPFAFDHVATAGPFALARLADGRVWQSLDRGASWAEVEGPIGARADGAIANPVCSTVGCDLGDWYRIGWASTPPAAVLDPQPAESGAVVGGVPVPKLACTPSAPVKRTSLPRGEKSPEDIGLGMNHLAVGNEAGTIGYVRAIYSRLIVSPVYGAVDTPTDDGAARALVHGFATISADDGSLVQQGPTKSITALRRDVTYVAPFDPAGVVRKAAFAATDAMAAMRGAGVLASAASLAIDPAIIASMVPLTTTDPTAPDGLAFACDTGVVGSFGTKTRVSFLASRADDSRPVSAVALDGDEVALLIANSSGQERIVKTSAAGAVGLFDVQAPPSSYGYPTNVDALAIGPKGELGVLRTPSAGEPASEFDPALIIPQNGPAIALAPWSTLVAADDAACKGDPTGWRATLQTSSPWITLSGPDVAPQDVAMVARVRWGAARVCLEAVELRSDDMQLVVPTANVMSAPTTGATNTYSWDGPVENWIVAKFAGGAVAGRVGVTPGVELRQPFTCTLAPP